VYRKIIGVPPHKDDIELEVKVKKRRNKMK